MKRLYLLRHGIAVLPGTPGFADDERPLTARGEKHVRRLAQGLQRLEVELERIFTSPLPRALKTAEIVAEVLGLGHALETVEALRADRDASAIREWLRGRSEQSLMIVGHNPSISELVGLLLTGTSGSIPLELRKGGVAALHSTRPGQAMELEWLARPRLLRRLGDP